MDDYYYKKYMKYKIKFLKKTREIEDAINTKKQRVDDVKNKHLTEEDFITIIKTINDHLGKDEWVLSGSYAIKLYLKYCKLKNLLTDPRDVDIIYVSNQNLNPINIGDFIPVQKSSEKSMSFKKNDNLSFDIVETVPSKKYYEINGYKLESPDNMIHRYQDSKSSRGKDKEGKLKSAEDNLKLQALYKIKECIDKQNLELKKISVNKKTRSPLKSDNNSLLLEQLKSDNNSFLPEPPRLARSLFGDMSNFDNI